AWPAIFVTQTRKVYQRSVPYKKKVRTICLKGAHLLGKWCAPFGKQVRTFLQTSPHLFCNNSASVFRRERWAFKNHAAVPPNTPSVGRVWGCLETQGETAARGGFVFFVGFMRRLLPPMTSCKRSIYCFSCFFKVGYTLNVVAQSIAPRRFGKIPY
ncbi:MAG: hypothetical protein OT477_24020, partial [Chloroflexi bacterium]|nr:hypothetical protein [Chloroflexota bacterium]